MAPKVEKVTSRGKKGQATAGGRGSSPSSVGSKGRSDAEANEDARSSRRIPIDMLVDYQAGGHYLFDYCRDLGAGGIFIETKTPLPKGSSVSLQFTLPDSRQVLKTHGTVIWVQEAIRERSDLRPGMGVQFTSFSSEQRTMLDEFIQKHRGEVPKKSAS